jgi:hypothetical protein
VILETSDVRGLTLVFLAKHPDARVHRGGASSEVIDMPFTVYKARMSVNA